MSAWETLRQTPKWKKKLNYALQLSLDKLSKFEEEFAIRQVERAIESGWKAPLNEAVRVVEITSEAGVPSYKDLKVEDHQ